MKALSFYHVFAFAISITAQTTPNDVVAALPACDRACWDKSVATLNCAEDDYVCYCTDPAVQDLEALLNVCNSPCASSLRATLAKTDGMLGSICRAAGVTLFAVFTTSTSTSGTETAAQDSDPSTPPVVPVDGEERSIDSEVQGSTSMEISASTTELPTTSQQDQAQEPRQTASSGREVDSSTNTPKESNADSTTTTSSNPTTAQTPIQPTESSTPTTSSKGPSTGAIIALSIGGFCLVIIAYLAFFYFRRYQKRRSADRQQPSSSLPELKSASSSPPQLEGHTPNPGPETLKVTPTTAGINSSTELPVPPREASSNDPPPYSASAFVAESRVRMEKIYSGAGPAMTTSHPDP